MYLRAAAVALLALGLAGCSKTTEGAVALTTEPGPPINSPTRAPSGIPGLPNIQIPGLPDIQIPNLPLPTRKTDVPEVPAPPNALTMSCREFIALDDPTRLAVIREILKQESNPLGPDGEGIGEILVKTACQFLPGASVNEILLGGTPPR
ncbi:Uncharacterised protein [Mycolicibacterium phlei]|jgi:hypothetical protein|nr:hypothetical protein [Mycolicibacterium phlei]AMO59086.1 hypothetical protein MPHLCCUG_00241 [Mycolicibacterium phlei]STZ15208.1 Uncharacterised protein [Mycolicibacterium phlei]VEG07218.1 Uncharacterised protein [Mycobacteroides chelonae]